MKTEIHQLIDAILPELIALRHELHRHPEIRWEEKWTSRRVARFLEENSIPHTRGHAKGTGIVATLKGAGDAAVALRADMDALEIQEETGLPYASEIPNRMHACGHDGHTAILCGVAKTLARCRDRLKGEVRLIFQPAEEIAGGGRFIVEEGLLDEVSAVFALHGWPTLPAGTIGVRSGWFMASAQDFSIEICGHGCHGADPAAGVDPILTAAHITTALQSIVSREIDPWRSGVVTVARIEAGHATNVIPERAMLAGTFRAIEPAALDTLRAAIARIAQQTARAFRAEAHVNFGGSPYPALFNHEEETNFVRKTARSVLGKDKVIDLPNPCMTAEDFAFYLQAKPGAYFCLGVNPSEQAPYPPLHSPKYDFTDAAIPVAIRVMTQLAIDYLERKT